MYYLSLIVSGGIIFFGYIKIFFDKSFLKHKKILYLNLAVFFIFALIAYFAKAGFLNGINLNISNAVASIWHINVAYFMIYVSDIFSPEWFSVISTVIIFILMYFKKNNLAVFFLFSIVGAISTHFSLKEFVAISRPVNSFIIETGLSFPSGHATVSLVFFLFFTFLVCQLKIKNSLKFFYTTLFVFLALLVSFSRLYLGVHYLSDILGGLILGLFWLTFGFLVANLFSQKFTESNILQ